MVQSQTLKSMMQFLVFTLHSRFLPSDRNIEPLLFQKLNVKSIIGTPFVLKNAKAKLYLMQLKAEYILLFQSCGHQ